MSDSIIIKSLGETSLIGTLYNARNLEFINYLRLFDFTKLPKHVVQSIPVQYSFQKTCKKYRAADQCCSGSFSTPEKSSSEH